MPCFSWKNSVLQKKDWELSPHQSCLGWDSTSEREMIHLSLADIGWVPLLDIYGEKWISPGLVSLTLL